MGGNVNDNESLESILTPPGVHVSMVMKAAASLWKSCTREYQDGLVERANKLNKTPLPVSIKKPPKDIFVDEIEFNVRLSLQLDWMFVVNSLRAMEYCVSES